MFGGTVDLRNLSVVNVGDDAYDIDAGYQGRVQNLFIKMDAGSDRGHEMDSKTNGDLDSQPRSHPHFANVTVISSVAHGEDALRLREGTGGDFRNYIIHGANEEGDGDNSFAEFDNFDGKIENYNDVSHPDSFVEKIEEQEGYVEDYIPEPLHEVDYLCQNTLPDEEIKSNEIEGKLLNLLKIYINYKSKCCYLVLFLQ